MQNKFRVPASGGVALGLLTFTFLCFSPGLSGNYILDDVINLGGLQSLSSGGFDDWLAYIFGGVGASGRPVSYLSFAVQYFSWPDPYEFKLVNVSIHALNGILVYFLCLRLLAENVSTRPRAKLFASAMAFVWLLHPIQVSSTLYVVQRMTLLSAFFTLSALLTWISLTRESLSLPRRWFFIVVFGGLSLAAVFSKENGALIPFFVVVIDAYYRLVDRTQNRDLWYRLLCVYLPILLIVSYFLVFWERYFVVSYEYRDFSLIERVLTQPRVLIDYIVLMLAPVPGQYTLFYENYPISTGFFRPFSTFTSLILIGFSGLLAFLYRKKYPLIFLGVGLFLCGHLLESTVVSLELYFEHRNYFALLGLAFVAVGFLASIRFRFAQVLFICLALLWVLNMLYTQQKEIKVWGNTSEQAVQLYESNPTSHRAHGHLGAVMFKSGQVELAAEFYQSTVHLFPDDITKPLLWLELRCLSESLAMPGVEEIRSKASRSVFYKETFNIAQGIITLMENGKCDIYVARALGLALVELLDNKEYSKSSFELNVLLGKLYGVVGDSKNALLHMEKAREQSPRVDVLLALMQLNSGLGRYGQIVKLEDELRRVCGLNYEDFSCIKYKNEITRILQELNLEHDPDPSQS